MPAQGMWTGLSPDLLLTSFSATSLRQYAFHMRAVVQTALQFDKQIKAVPLQAVPKTPNVIIQTNGAIQNIKHYIALSLLSFRYRKNYKRIHICLFGIWYH